MNPNRARWISHYVKLLQEIVGPSKDWPRAISYLCFSARHLKNRDRFTVIVFLLTNGVSPGMVKEFFDRVYSFDRQAWSHIDWIIKNYPTKNWKAWNVALQKTI